MKRCCPVCGASSEYSELFLDKNIDFKKLNSYSYASRKIPEYMCHELTRCLGCGLVYVAEPPAQSELAQAYHESDYDSSAEAEDAASSYLKSLTPYLDVINKDSALEIGAGNGIFMQKLLGVDFKSVQGVEPSIAAINTASLEIKNHIKHDIFNESDFLPQSFDLICCFMTLEHVQDPGAITKSAFNLLKPGGLLVYVTHDYSSFVNRLLGKKSPIIDIEHMQLFNKCSISKLLSVCKFNVMAINSFYNSYTIAYWIKLMPLPGMMKGLLLKFVEFIGVEHFKVSINVGNIMSVGVKPR